MPYRILELKLKLMRERTYTYTQLFVFSMSIFTLSALLGAVFHPLIALPAYKSLLEPSFKGVDTMAQTLGGTRMASALAIFIKNTFAVLVTIALARRTRGISVAILLILNGVLIGAVLSHLHAVGYTVSWILAGVLPHGSFELTAFFLGSNAGLKLLLCTEQELALRKKEISSLSIAVTVALIFNRSLHRSFL